MPRPASTGQYVPQKKGSPLAVRKLVIGQPP